MKIIDETNKIVTIEMTHEQSLMIMALIRESCHGTLMGAFDTRVGYPREEVGKIGPELNNILYEVDISE